MKVLSVILFIGIAMACRDGYYGDECNNGCSAGCAAVDGAIATCGVEGLCNTTPDKCNDGWKSMGTVKDCATPICFGSGGCAEGGSCIAPNYCICGKSGAQIVGIDRMHDADGVKTEGTQCVSLRKDGIFGALVALVVMAVSISTCGLIAEKVGKPK